jgi:high-affinity iron transporter
MLINAVVLWLRETLPLLLLLSVLLAIWPTQQRRIVALGIGGGALLVLLMSTQLRVISGWFDGQGLELTYSLLYLSCALLLVLAVLVRREGGAQSFGQSPAQSQARSATLGALALLCLCGIHGHNLMLYLWVYPHAQSEHANLWLGSALGAGIGGSVALLLYVAAQEGARLWRLWPAVLLSLLTARQCAAAVAIWLQTGWLNAHEVLWDSSALIDEKSEYGNFFNALLGYEATPDPTLLVVQLSSFVAMLWCCRQLEIRA